MKKVPLLLLLSALFLSGCGVEDIKFNGESNNWRGEYNAYIDNSTENGEYVFVFKKAQEDQVVEDLKIVINNGEVVLNESEHKGRTIKIPSSCSGCAVTDTETSIQVTIEWGEGNEETFSIDPK
ncbi:hypothetical protein GCM10007063_30070 [Lentibacillus kapialis]|uniref:Lipoprotein n=1 Tax=Lentibacillus kapialis TaxID=340214 RepID=A0A917V0K8_9BACI|nr:hypothetical protein [Lentibacillus kapialis]GGK05630.1 hypothetical protein GCM10007063_30070 [Lentibacillus kapialis]